MTSIRLPPGLSEEAKKYWPEIQEELEGNDLLHSVHMLHQFMENYCQWRFNLAKVREEGPMVETKKGLADSPYQLAADRNERKMAEIIMRYGSKPTDRNISIEEDDSLNPRMRNFIREYAIDHHGAKAAIRAGYSRKGAASKASQLLSNVNLKGHIQRLERQITEDINVTQDMVYRGFLAEAQGTGPDTNSAARNQAWQLLGKLKGMFKHDNLQKSSAAAVLDRLDPTALFLFEKQLKAELKAREKAVKVKIKH